MTGQKLKKYLIDNGLQQKELAKFLGIEPCNVSALIEGRQKIPPRHWSKIIEFTKGYITLQDVMQDKLHRIENLKFKESQEAGVCTVYLCDLNNQEVIKNKVGI